MISKCHEKKSELMKRIGSFSQIAGLRRYQLIDGAAAGVECVDVRTGAGLCYTVLPGRCMDIAWADYRGETLSYISRTGIVSSNFYDPRGMEWLKGFFGGLLTTCGLSNVGMPCSEVDPVIGERQFGLHGRIAYTPAADFGLDADWDDEGRYVMRLKGVMREATVHCENLSLTRTISSEFGRNVIRIEDVVENRGFSPAPLMLLYHINFGYPLLDADSRVFGSSLRATPRTDEAVAEPDGFDRFSEPQHGYRERLYSHEMASDRNGEACIGLVNERLGYGLAISYKRSELPYLTEWKMMNETEYVVGLEPGNARAIGRTRAREEGELGMIAPGEKRRFGLSLEVLVGAEDISAFRQRARSVVGAGAAK
jgi:hypothetical protein